MTLTQNTTKACAAMALAMTAAIATSAVAAPLDPINTNINMQVGGFVRLDTDEPRPEARYNLQGQSDSFVDGGTSLASSVINGGTPMIQHTGEASSSSGVRFEQVSENEYVLTMSSSAMGSLMRSDSPGYHYGEYGAFSNLDLQAEFSILSYPGQDIGMPSTIHFELEHYGQLSTGNSGRAFSEARVHIDAPSPDGPFNYYSQLETPNLPLGYFEDADFTGTRNIVAEGQIATRTGEMIWIDANIISNAHGMLDEYEPMNSVDSASLWDSGLRLHMTVMPEPSSMILLACSGLLLRRRRVA